MRGTGSIMEGLLTMLLSDRFGAMSEKAQGPRSPEAERLREEVRKKLSGNN